MRLPPLFISLASIVGVLIVPATAPAASYTYPGPGCRSNLQACIDQAPSGSTIRIARNTVDQRIKITKSLTLTKAEGFTPTLGGATPRTFPIRSPKGKAVRVTFKGLTFDNVELDAELSRGSGHSFRLLDSEVSTKDNAFNGDRGISIFSNGTLQVQIKNSTIESDGQAIQISTSAPFGISNFVIEGNEITSLDNNESMGGMYVGGRGGGVVNAQIRSNVIHDVSGCNCGNPSGMFLEIAENIEGHFDVSNNTIDDIDGVGIWFHVDNTPGSPRADFTFYNNTISNTQTAFYAPQPLAEVTFLNGYNNFYANTGSPSFGSWQEGPRTTSADPGFVDEANGDYRLQPASSLINEGNYLIPGAVSPLDADTNARVNQAQVDLGAYEQGSRKGCTIIGTTGPDEIDGTPGRDTICGDGGDDTLRARGSSDLVLGGDGEDTLWGDAGADVLSGGADADDLQGRDGVKGNDKLNGQGSDDNCLADPRDKKTSC